MNKFEETVVNPNISLKNFEVKVQSDDVVIHKHEVADSTIKKESNKNYKALLLLAILTSVFIYQISLIL